MKRLVIVKPIRRIKKMNDSMINYLNQKIKAIHSTVDDIAEVEDVTELQVAALENMLRDYFGVYVNNYEAYEQQDELALDNRVSYPKLSNVIIMTNIYGKTVGPLIMDAIRQDLIDIQGALFERLLEEETDIYTKSMVQFSYDSWLESTKKPEETDYVEETSPEYWPEEEEGGDALLDAMKSLKVGVDDLD